MAVIVADRTIKGFEFALFMTAALVAILWLPQRILPPESLSFYSTGLGLSIAVEAAIRPASKWGLATLSRRARISLWLCVAFIGLILFADLVTRGWVPVARGALTGVGVVALLVTASNGLECARRMVQKLWEPREVATPSAGAAR